MKKFAGSLIRLAFHTCASAVLAGFVGVPAYAQDAKTLVIADAFEPRANYALSSEDSYLLVRAGCLETLTTTNFDLELVPALATEWTQVQPTSWEFKIRPDVTFQNGEKLTAATVANALNKLLKSEVPARSFRPEQITSVEAAGDMVVRINTVKEDVLLPYSVGTPFTGILAPAAYKDDGTVDFVGTCTGPYKVVERDGVRSLKMQRNAQYWGQPANIENVQLLFIPDANVRATMVRSGEVGIAKELPLTALEQLKATSGITTEVTPVLRTTALIFNTKKGYLADPRVREAISLVVDPEVVSAAVYDGVFPPAVGPFAPTTPWAMEGATYRAADVAKAKELLKAAGVEPGTLKLEVIAYTERPQFQDIGAIAQQQLAEVGIDLRVRTGDFASVEGDIMSGNFDMTFMSRGYVYEFADLIGYFRFDFVCGGSFNLAQYCNPDFDKTVEKAAATADLGERTKIYKDLGEQIRTQTLHHFLVHESTIDAFTSSLSNYRVDRLQLHYLNSDMKLAP